MRQSKALLRDRRGWLTGVAWTAGSRSRLQAIKEDWWVRHSWLVRLANAVYLKLRHPLLHVPDPTERLIDRMRQFVEAGGGKFLVGLQTSDAALVRHLEAARIPFVAFDGAAS